MLRTVRFALLLVLILGCAWWGIARTADYSIMSWRYGVVVWPGDLNTYLSVPERFVDRLTEAVDEAFAFWGFAPPEPVLGWTPKTRHPGRLSVVGSHDLRIVNDTGEEILVPNLAWEGDWCGPFVVIPFVGNWRMYDALGATATFAAQFFYRPLVRAYPEAEPWIHEVGRGYRTMICASYAGDDVLIHEFVHWFQWEWCEANGVPALMLPGFIREGMAEATSADAGGSPYTAWDRQAVLDWAEDHCLSEGVGTASRYTVGESLVAYLVSELGRDGFLGTLSGWMTDPTVLIEEHEPGWRESLGLPKACDSEAGGSE